MTIFRIALSVAIAASSFTTGSSAAVETRELTLISSITGSGGSLAVSL